MNSAAAAVASLDSVAILAPGFSRGSPPELFPLEKKSIKNVSPQKEHRELYATAQTPPGWRKTVPRRASNCFTYPRFGPLFLRTSSYAQSCPNREHVPQLGFFPSHLSFLFLQTTQAMRLVRGM